MPIWILILIVLLIIGIILDGVRRVRIHRRENIRISKRAKLADKEIKELANASDVDHGSDFPSGGARVISVRDQKRSISTTQSSNAQSHTSKSSSSQRLPEQVTLNLDETVPMLMDPVGNENEKPHANKKVSNAKADLGILAMAPGEEDDNNIDNNEYVQKHTEDNSFSDSTYSAEPSLGSLDNLDDIDEPLSTISSPNSNTHSSSKSESKKTTASFGKNKGNKTKGKGKKKNKNSNNKPESNQSVTREPEEVLIVNVMAKQGFLFDGDTLLKAFMDNHLKFGDMDIFHRHVHENGDGSVLFSVANMVVPGTFSLSNMQDFQSPGVSIFMTLPVDEESLTAFNIMIQTARKISTTLGGELKDENRSVMTNQTIEHARQKVLDYERKRKLHSSQT